MLLLLERLRPLDDGKTDESTSRCSEHRHRVRHGYAARPYHLRHAVRTIEDPCATPVFATPTASARIERSVAVMSVLGGSVDDAEQELWRGRRACLELNKQCRNSRIWFFESRYNSVPRGAARSDPCGEFGKPVKLRRCPRNGHGTRARDISHWVEDPGKALRSDQLVSS